MKQLHLNFEQVKALVKKGYEIEVHVHLKKPGWVVMLSKQNEPGYFWDVPFYEWANTKAINDAVTQVFKKILHGKKAY